MRFWFCSGGSQRDSLSLWIVENSTGPDEQRRLWHTASESKSERGWRLITLPLYGLADWYAHLLHLLTDSSDCNKAVCLDCLQASNCQLHFKCLRADKSSESHSNMTLTQSHRCSPLPHTPSGGVFVHF